MSYMAPDGENQEEEGSDEQGELTQEELSLTMEEVTCDEGVGVEEAGGGEMEIDEQQGVPLINRKKCQVRDRKWVVRKRKYKTRNKSDVRESESGEVRK